MVQKIGAIAFEHFKKFKGTNVFNMCYIEGIVFVLLFSHALSGTILRNEIISQVCTTIFEYNYTDCKLLGTNNVTDEVKRIETEVQPYVANLFMIRTILESIVPAIIGIFVGSWSDHYGRKPLMFVSMIGFSFTYLITAVIYEISQYYVVNPWYYILAVVPHSILGGNCLFSVAAFCFLSDVTNTKTRPYRMIFMEAVFFVGLTSGSLLSSYLYAATNATTTFAISGLSMTITTILIGLYLPESLHLKTNEIIETSTDDNKWDTIDLKPVTVESPEKKEVYTISKSVADTMADNQVFVKDDKLRQSTTNSNDTEENQVDWKTINISDNVEETSDRKETPEIPKTDIEKPENKTLPEVQTDVKKTANEKSPEVNTGLFSSVHIKDMFRTTIKSRPYYDRCIILLMTSAMFIAIFVIDGIMNVFYLFVREKFQWTVRDFSYFETVGHLVPMTGAIVGFVILRKIFKMSVVSVAILSFISTVLSNIVTGLASKSWHLYLSVVFGAFRSLAGPMCRTIVSNIVPPTDLGKIFTIKNVLQSMAPFVASPLYTFIYNQSLTTNPGLFNFVSAALYMIPLICMIFVLRFKHLHKDHYAEVLK